MILFEKVVAQAAWPVTATVCVLMGFLILWVAVRRAKGSLESKFTHQKTPLCHALLDSAMTVAIRYQDALAQLRAMRPAEVRTLLATILTSDKNPTRERAEVLRKLCEDFGLVAIWHRRLSKDAHAHRSLNSLSPLRRLRPLTFVLRAEAAENLGVIRHQPSWRLLVDTLDDSNGAVQSAAARSLARIQEPESFAALTDRLESAAKNPRPTTSVRSLKMALACFPVSQAARLRKLLEHSHPSVRLAASDVVGLMVQRESAEKPNAGFSASELSPQLAEIFLTRLTVDEDPDVRARAADVVACLEPFRAMPVLTPLLADPAWFVRLHAVRALQHRRFAALTPLTQRLTDPNWRVREAAAQTLAARGHSGVQKLFQHFLATGDRYSQEQVVEQIERAGLIPSVLEAYGQQGGELETRFVEEIVQRGFADILLPALQEGPPPEKALAPELPHTPKAKVDLLLHQLTSFGSNEQSIREGWPANGSEAAESDAERPAIEVS